MQFDNGQPVNVETVYEDIEMAVNRQVEAITWLIQEGKDDRPRILNMISKVGDLWDIVFTYGTERQEEMVAVNLTYVTRLLTEYRANHPRVTWHEPDWVRSSQHPDYEDADFDR
jgi:hypothetical protein